MDSIASKTISSSSISITPQYWQLGSTESYAPADAASSYIDYTNLYTKAQEDILNCFNKVHGKKEEPESDMNKKDKKDEICQYDGVYFPKRIVFNPPATIVFWKDGTKTVVKCSEGETFNEYNGFCAALAKKIFGYNSQLVRLVKKGERQGTPDEYAYAIGKIALTPKKEPAKKAPVKKSAPKKPTATKKTVSTKNEQKGTATCKKK